MRKNPRRILSPQRLPFRHPGAGFTNLTNRPVSCNTPAPVLQLRNRRAASVLTPETTQNSIRSANCMTRGCVNRLV